MKQTAVEWLIEQILEIPLDDSTNAAHLKKYVSKVSVFEKAKKMEKENIKMCCIRTMETCNSEMDELRCKTMDDYFNYIYNETFKSE